MAYLASRETVKLELNGFWILAKKELTYGEQRMLRAVIVQYDEQGTPCVLNNMEDAQPLFIVTALTDWSLEDNGKKLPITEETIDNLSESVVLPILDALGKLYTLEDTKKKES